MLGSRRSTPFTIGIEAGWGMGKSSLMRRLQARLEKEDDVDTVWFNAWTAEDERVLEGLIKSVLAKLDQNVLRRTARNKRLLTGVRFATPIVASVVGLGGVVDQIWQRVEADPKARNEMRDLMDEAMRNWIASGQKDAAGRLLVVFVDDLDRCSPGNVFQVFEAIKLHLDAPGLVFVVGFDRNVISDSILREKKFSEAITSRDYLEKILQIDYRIPSMTDEQADDLLDSFVERSKTQKLFDAAARRLVIERNARNPRRIKRFINGFILVYGLDTEWEELGAESLIKALILQMYFPDFFRMLDDRTQGNPFAEFSRYLEVRNAFRRRVRLDEPAWEPVGALLRHLGLAEPGAGDDFDHDELLRRVEQEVPESFPALAADDAFVSLIGSLGDGEERERLVRKLERRGDGAGPPVPEPPIEEAVPSVRLDGLDVLWIDDRPPSVAREVQIVSDRGATVTMVESLEQLRGRLAGPRPPDVVVSDFSRAGDTDAGLRDAQTLRGERAYEGAILFYGSRITPTRRRLVEELGDAAIASTPAELVAALDELRQIVARARPRGRAAVFIDYRREDAAAYAGRLYDALSSRLGTDRVFMDVDVAPGENWSEAIHHALREAEVFVEVIGPGWLEARDAEGRRRIEQPQDFVRLALATALATSTVRVVPVLVGGATMPAPDELPAELERLAMLNALELSDTRWRDDVDRLLNLLEPAGAQPASKRAPLPA